MVSRATVKSRLTVLAGVAIAAAAGAALARTDQLLSRGFGNALDAPRPGLTFEITAAKEQPQGAAAGDEGYWLTRAEVESPTPFAKPLNVGDRITIAGHDGRERQLEVVDLKAIGGSSARTGAGGASAPPARHLPDRGRDGGQGRGARALHRRGGAGRACDARPRQGPLGSTAPLGAGMCGRP